MKKNIYNIIIGMSLLIYFTGCQNDDIPNLRINAEDIQVEYKRDTVNIPISCNIASKSTIIYDSSEESNWIFLLPTVLNSDGVLTLWISEYNNVLKDRSATIVVTAGNETKEIHITQMSKPSLAIEPVSIATISNDAKSYQVTVTCRGEWKAIIDDEASSWCTLSNNTGEGPGILTVHVSALNSNEMRMGTITLSTGDIHSTVTVQQGYGTIINGLVWAKCDVNESGRFATSPDVKGLLYQYNSNTGYPNSSPNVSECPAGFKTGAYNTEMKEWDLTNNPCPKGWRIPTIEEIQILTEGNKFAWVEPNHSGFLVPGAIVGVIKEKAILATKADMKGGIFWPQSGYRSTDGKQTVWWPANITSNASPNGGWDRPTCWIDGSNNIGCGDWAGSCAAYPVRCVADIE